MSRVMVLSCGKHRGGPLTAANPPAANIRQRPSALTPSASVASTDFAKWLRYFGVSDRSRVEVVWIVRGWH